MGLTRRKLLASLAAVTGAGPPLDGTVYNGSADTAEFSALVRKGSGMRLVLLRDREQVRTQPITSDEQTVTLTQPIGTGG